MLLGLVVGTVAFLIGYGLAYRDTSNRERDVQRARDALATERRELETGHESLKRDEESFQNTRTQVTAAIKRDLQSLHDALSSGFLNGRQWLANAYSEWVDVRNLETECWLAIKPHKAEKAAEAIAELRARHREAVFRLKLLEYQLASYEEYFPELVEYRDAILDEAIELRGNATVALEETDPALAKGYLSKDEYAALPTSEKFQRALDRYWKRDKTNWEIGRLYERYIGYTYEQAGWRVTYQGALLKFEDFGRDLICVRNGMTHVVQCKCWSKRKTIREKHVFQLYGTSVLFEVHNPETLVRPVLATPTPLSSDALAVADKLDVELKDLPLPARYPAIKCNVSTVTGERIYHLPFDQQYDRVVIGDQAGEFYAETIEEAEASGFRRAFRWRPEQADGA